MTRVNKQAHVHIHIVSTFLMPENCPNSLDPDLARQNIVLALHPDCLKL